MWDLPGPGIKPKSPALSGEFPSTAPQGSRWGVLRRKKGIRPRNKGGVWGFPGGSDGKESVCSAEAPGSIPGSGRFPGEGNGNWLQYSFLENLMDRRVWWTTVHGVHRVRHNWVTKQDHTSSGSGRQSSVGSQQRNGDRHPSATRKWMLPTTRMRREMLPPPEPSKRDEACWHLVKAHWQEAPVRLLFCRNVK